MAIIHDCTPPIGHAVPRVAPQLPAQSGMEQSLADWFSQTPACRHLGIGQPIIGCRDENGYLRELPSGSIVAQVWRHGPATEFAPDWYKSACCETLAAGLTIRVELSHAETFSSGDAAWALAVAINEDGTRYGILHCGYWQPSETADGSAIPRRHEGGRYVAAANRRPILEDAE